MEKDRTTSAPFLKVVSHIEKLLKPCRSFELRCVDPLFTTSYSPGNPTEPKKITNLPSRPPTIGQPAAVKQTNHCFPNLPICVQEVQRVSASPDI